LTTFYRKTRPKVAIESPEFHTDMACRYNEAYYNEGESLVSDFEYDQMFSELAKLEAQYPMFRLPNSPTARVGAPVSDQYNCGLLTLRHSHALILTL
jgi:NAD-dependent DNA ligase